MFTPKNHFKKTKRSSFLTAIVMSIIAVGVASNDCRADAIAVANHDFETGGLGDGLFSAGVVPAGWTGVGNDADDTFFGYFNPADFNYGGTAGSGINGSMVGPNVFYFGDLSDGEGIEQTLGALFALDTGYDVTVAMGRRQTQFNQNLRMDLFAGASLLATVTHDGTTVPFGSFEDRSLTYTFDVADAGLVGSALRIRFTESDNGQVELDIDNIRVNGVASVPEPSSCGAALLGLVAFTLRRKRQV